MAASGAIETKEERPLFQRFLAWLRQEHPEEHEARAVSFPDLYEHVWSLLPQLDMGQEDYYSYPWLNDLYDDGDGNTFAIISSGGKMYRSEVTVTDNTVSLGDPQEVVIEFVPRSVMRITRHNGQTRALIIAGSSVINRCGEIDSRDLFDSFIAHAKETGEFPEYGFYHLWDEERRSFGEFRLGQVDWVGREGNLYLASILFDDTELARAAVASIEAEPDYWGNSIGFKWIDDGTGAYREMVDVGDGITVPVYKKGRNHEISLLPEAEAAAWFTRVEITEEKAMREAEREALLKLFGGDESKVTAFLEEAGAVDRSITEAGLVTRQKQAEAEGGGAASPSGDPAGEEEETEELPPVELDDEALEALTEQVLATPTLQGLVESFAALRSEVDSLATSLEKERARATKAEQRLATLERDEGDKQREWQADLPRKATQKVTYRPRTAHREAAESSPLVEETAIVEATLDKVPKY